MWCSVQPSLIDRSAKPRTVALRRTTSVSLRILASRNVATSSIFLHAPALPAAHGIRAQMFVSLPPCSVPRSKTQVSVGLPVVVRGRTKDALEVDLVAFQASAIPSTINPVIAFHHNAVTTVIQGFARLDLQRCNAIYTTTTPLRASRTVNAFTIPPAEFVRTTTNVPQSLILHSAPFPQDAIGATTSVWLLQTTTCAPVCSKTCASPLQGVSGTTFNVTQVQARSAARALPTRTNVHGPLVVLGIRIVGVWAQMLAQHSARTCLKITASTLLAVSGLESHALATTLVWQRVRAFLKPTFACRAQAVLGMATRVFPPPVATRRTSTSVLV